MRIIWLKGGSKSKQFLSIWDGRKNMSWTCYGQSHDVSLSPPFYNHLQVRIIFHLLLQKLNNFVVTIVNDSGK